MPGPLIYIAYVAGSALVSLIASSCEKRTFKEEERNRTIPEGNDAGPTDAFVRSDAERDGGVPPADASKTPDARRFADSAADAIAKDGAPDTATTDAVRDTSHPEEDAEKQDAAEDAGVDAAPDAAPDTALPDAAEDAGPDASPPPPDFDGDGVPDVSDNCREIANRGQEDLNNDGEGDACDTDIDGDDVNNDADNCRLVPNPDQADDDGDRIGNACDRTPFPDRDDDTVPDMLDNCPDAPNESQEDDITPCDPAINERTCDGDACDDSSDSDGFPDLIDNCPHVANPDQLDADRDGDGDACDMDDSDGDGVPDIRDNCPDTPNPDQAPGFLNGVPVAQGARCTPHCERGEDQSEEVSIQEGQSTEVTWSASGGEEVTCDGQREELVPPGAEANVSFIVRPETTTAYDECAVNGFGLTAVCPPITVRVNHPPVIDANASTPQGRDIVSDGDGCFSSPNHLNFNFRATDPDGDELRCGLTITGGARELFREELQGVGPGFGFSAPAESFAANQNYEWNVLCEDENDGIDFLEQIRFSTRLAQGCGDRDGDGVVDRRDNCPDVRNPGQEDSNGDGIGDACQPNRPPQVGPLVSPSDGALGVVINEGENHVFIGQASDPDGDALVCTAHVYDNNGDEIASGSSEPAQGRQMNISVLNDGSIEDRAIYCWDMSCEDRPGNSVQSEDQACFETGRPNLVLRWSMDEERGDQVLDRSGNGRSGQLLNGPLRVQGIRGQAVELDGSDNSVEMQQERPIGIADTWTISFWTLSEEARLATFFTIGLRNGPNRYRNYTELVTDGAIFLVNYYGNTIPEGQETPPSSQYRTVNTDLPENQWVHIALTSSGGQNPDLNSFHIYLNGVSLNLQSNSATFDPQAEMERQISLGHELGAQRYVNGRLDEFNIFDRALTPEEVLEECERFAPAGVNCGP